MGELLDLASAGEHIIVERDRRPLAVLVPYEDALRLRESPDRAKARALAALDRLDAYAERMTASYPDAAQLPPAERLVRDEREGGHGDAG